MMNLSYLPMLLSQTPPRARSNGSFHERRRKEFFPRKEEVPMKRQQDEQTPTELPSSIITMMTTEHYNLQSGR